MIKQPLPPPFSARPNPNHYRDHQSSPGPSLPVPLSCRKDRHLNQKDENPSPSFAFITHSQEGLRHNLPPSIDNAGLARRRRRRTSHHDQAILEEEYRKCDKPDKAKRKEIAARVDMGEKEVQIWFQNKRQSARRKLKPLLPQDLIPALRSSSPLPFNRQLSSRPIRYEEHSFGQSSDLLNSDDISINGRSSDNPRQRHPRAKQLYTTEPTTDEEYHESLRRQIHSCSQITPDRAGAPARERSSFPAVCQPSFHKMSTHSRLQEAVYSDSGQVEAAADQQPSQPIAPTTGKPYKPRRTDPSSGSTNYYPPTLIKRSSSFLRLSTNLEGKAEVIPLEARESVLSSPLIYQGTSTPSRLPALHSSSSFVESPQSNAADSIRRRTIDSKVWEYACDHQATLHSDCSFIGRHAALEPDEAGVALEIGIARSRSRATTTSHYSKISRENSLLLDPHPEAKPSGDGSGTAIKRRGSNAEALKRRNTEKKSLAQLPSEVTNSRTVAAATSAKIGKEQKSITGNSASLNISARKRAYHEALNENTENCQVERASLTKPTSTIPPLPSRKTPISSYCTQSTRLLGGGEDYYVGGESDKENRPNKPASQICHVLEAKEKTFGLSMSQKRKHPASRVSDGFLIKIKSSSSNAGSLKRASTSAPSTVKKISLKTKKMTIEPISISASGATLITKKRKVPGESSYSDPCILSSSSCTDCQFQSQACTCCSSHLNPPTLSGILTVNKANSASTLMSEFEDVGGKENAENAHVINGNVSRGDYSQKGVYQEKDGNTKVIHQDVDDLGGAELLLSLRGGSWS